MRLDCLALYDTSEQRDKGDHIHNAMGKDRYHNILLPPNEIGKGDGKQCNRQHGIGLPEVIYGKQKRINKWREPLSMGRPWEQETAKIELLHNRANKHDRSKPQDDRHPLNGWRVAREGGKTCCEPGWQPRKEGATYPRFQDDYKSG